METLPFSQHVAPNLTKKASIFSAICRPVHNDNIVRKFNICVYFSIFLFSFSNF